MSAQQSSSETNINTYSGSLTDLRTLVKEDGKVTQRKRKQNFEVEIMQEMSDLRIEMKNYFQAFSEKLNEISSNLCQDMIEVKNEMKNIKNATDILTSEQNGIKEELKNLKTQNCTFQEEITLLKTKLSTDNKILCDVNKNQPQFDCEYMALEIQDRAKRQYNVIIGGISELNDKNSTIRREYDTNQALSIIQTIYKECPNPLRCIRLGKYNSEKTRYLKVTFQQQQTVIHILRNKSNLTNDNVRIFPDQTPMQIKYMKEQRAELLRRTESGESDLTIRYINGIPKIIKNTAKNYSINKSVDNAATTLQN